jgi:cleavage and polyadenylation specificity factor subunit 1
VFDVFHGMAHPGAKVTRRLMNQRMVWTCMSKDLTDWVKDCKACSRAKVTSQPAAAVQPIQVPQQQFSHIHVDIVGPLPVSKQGFRYLFTIIDRSSRMLEAVPLTNVKTETCRDDLISQWVARFGVTALLTSNKGAQFTSTPWARTSDVIGTHHNTTTAYHPQSNGMVERAQRRLKDALQARIAATEWPQHLSWVLLDMNNHPREDSGKSATEMVTLPAQPAASNRWTRYNRTSQVPPPAALAAADLVYVHKGGQVQPRRSSTVVPKRCWRRSPSTSARTSAASTQRSRWTD